MKSFFTEMFLDLYENFSEVFLNVIVMIIVMIAGLIISWFVKKLVQKLLILFRFDRWAHDSGMVTFLERGGVTSPPSAIISKIVFWILLITFFSFGLNFIGITQFTEYASQITNALPYIVISIIIVIVGIIFSTFLSKVIYMTCQNAHIGYSDIISKAVRVLLIIITFGIVFEYMGIGTTVIAITILIIFGGVIMTLSLALGIGLSNIIADFIRDRVKLRTQKKSDGPTGSEKIA